MLDINFLNCVAHTLFGKNCEYTINEELEKEADEQAVHLLLFPNSLGEISRSVNLECEHCEIHKLMTEAGIPYVILKGFASGHYYENPILRTYGDVDFLIKEEDFSRADKVLKENGYVRQKHAHENHWVYKHHVVEVEMHRKVNGAPKEGAMAKKTELYLKDIIDTAIEIECDSGKMKIPDEAHHGLVLLLHKATHMTESGMGVRHLCDWAVYVNAVSDRFEKINKKCFEDLGLWQFAKIITAVCEKYIGLPQQSWVKDVPEQLVDQLMEDIMDSGNFGQKKEFSYESVLIGNTNEDGKIASESMRKELFKTLNRKSYKICPFSRKIKIILPFIWMFIGIRYLFRVLTRKRELVNVNNMISNANSRRKMYSKLKLFQK